VVAELYVRAGLSVSETGRRLGVSGQVVARTAHDLGFPVRLGGPQPRHGPAEIARVEALYANPLIGLVLARHGIPKVPASGPIWPPVRLTGRRNATPSGSRAKRQRPSPTRLSHPIRPIRPAPFRLASHASNAPSGWFGSSMREQGLSEPLMVFHRYARWELPVEKPSRAAGSPQ
jgi:hypothetical protein